VSESPPTKDNPAGSPSDGIAESADLACLELADARLRQGTDTTIRDTLARLLADLPPEQVSAAGLGYHAGLIDGQPIGYARCEADEAARWHRVYVSTKATLDRPTHAELKRRRTTVRDCRCDRCSACVRRAALERSGTTP
jgi:hypothetical protein